MDLLGAVLAGGQSSRMGADKAGIVVGGRTMLERVVSAIEAVTADIVLLGAERPGFDCWPDQVGVSGPLAGISTALHRSEHKRILVVAVDNAYVRDQTLLALTAVESTLAVVPVDESGVRQVTCAVYPGAIADQAAEEAAAGGSIQSLLDRVSFHPITPDIWRGWGEDGRSWHSLDTPEAVAAANSRYG